MSSDARKLSPSKGGILSKWWFFLIIGFGVIALLAGLAAFGTVDMSFFTSDAFIGGVMVMIITAFVAKMIWEAHYVEYSLESDFNHEVKLGKKKGEFSFNLEGRTFYGVDCGSVKVILLQGTVATHEKKIQSPPLNATKGFSLQSFAGKKISRLVLRALPITDVNLILRLGWQGFEDIEKKKNVVVCNNLIRMIKSPQWSGVIWVAPYVPDEIYQKFMYSEVSLAEIECTYESKIDIIARDSNERVSELKNYYLHVGSEVFHRSCDVIRTTIQSYELAAGLVNYMLAKNPSEIQDTLAALNLEAKAKTLPQLLEEKVRELEQLKETLERAGGVVGLKNPEQEEQSKKLNSIMEQLQGAPGAIANKIRGGGKGMEQELPAQ